MGRRGARHRRELRESSSDCSWASPWCISECIAKFSCGRGSRKVTNDRTRLRRATIVWKTGEAEPAVLDAIAHISALSGMRAGEHLGKRRGDSQDGIYGTSRSKVKREMEIAREQERREGREQAGGRTMLRSK